MNWRFWRKTTNGNRRAPGSIMIRGFAAARTDRLLSGWSWDGGFTAQEISGQLGTIRARSRDMEKNSPHYRRWLDLKATNIVGEMFTFKSLPHDGLPGQRRLDDRAAKFIEYHWWRFCTQRDPKTGRTWCDSSGRKTMAQIDRLNVKTWNRDGEAFVEKIKTPDNPYGVTFRVIRPDCCDEKYNETGNTGKKPIVHCGVERDPSTLRPLAYYMRTTPGYADFIGPTGPLKRIPADRIIHVFTAHDEDQPRGVPVAHAALVKLKMLDEYDRAELTAARDEACTVRSYTADADKNTEEFADLTKEENSSQANALLQEKEPGQSQILPRGWKETVNTPQHPNREVTAFKASMLKDVASGLGVEYSNFCNDWSGVSFSSVRSGTISERDMRIVEQDDYIAMAKTPMFLFWLESFLAANISGGLPLAKLEKFSEHEFKGRRWMWVDPAKDLSAAETCVKHGWKTNAQISADMGTDFDDNIEVLKAENQKSKGVIQPETPPQPKAPQQPMIDPEDEEDDDENTSSNAK